VKKTFRSEAQLLTKSFKDSLKYNTSQRKRISLMTKRVDLRARLIAASEDLGVVANDEAELLRQNGVVTDACKTSYRSHNQADTLFLVQQELLAIETVRNNQISLLKQNQAEVEAILKSKKETHSRRVPSPSPSVTSGKRQNPPTSNVQPRKKRAI